MITETIVRKVLEVVDAGLVSGLGKPIPGQMCVEAAVCYAMGLPHSDKPDCVSPALRELKIRLNDARWSSNAARTAGLRRLALAQLGSAGVLNEREFGKRVAELTIRKAVPFALRTAANVQKDATKAANLRAAADVCERDGTRESTVKARAAADAAYAATTATTAAAAAAYAAAAAAAAAADAAAYVATATAAYVATTTAAYVATTAAAAAAYAATAAATTTTATAAAATATAAYVATTAYVARDKFLAEFCESVVQILIQMNAPGCQWLPLTEAA